MAYLIVSNEDIVTSEEASSQAISENLASNSIPTKKKALKMLIKQIINDESFPRMIMSVLQQAQIHEDHDLKKLLFLYWEVVEKSKPDGTAKDEMVLACNAMRQDLISPNEFIRGRALRLVSKIMI